MESLLPHLRLGQGTRGKKVIDDETGEPLAAFAIPADGVVSYAANMRQLRDRYVWHYSLSNAAIALRIPIW